MRKHNLKSPEELEELVKRYSYDDFEYINGSPRFPCIVVTNQTEDYSLGLLFVYIEDFK